MNIRCDICYNGSYFNGFQKQKEVSSKVITIQGEIEKILSKFYKKKINIIAASRTDAKVHANNQVFNFYADDFIPAEKIKQVLNKNLSPYIRVNSSYEVCKNFHSRYDVLDKTYKYIINMGDYNIFEVDTIYQYCKSIDFDKIDKVIDLIKGKKDFKAFMASGSDKTKTIRTINFINYRIFDKKVEFFINADGFLYNMVRIIIGVFLDINENRLNIDDVSIGIVNKDRSFFRRTAPPNGLYLDEIHYKDINL